MSSFLNQTTNVLDSKSCPSYVELIHVSIPSLSLKMYDPTRVNLNTFADSQFIMINFFRHVYESVRT